MKITATAVIFAFSLIPSLRHWRNRLFLNASLAFPSLRVFFLCISINTLEFPYLNICFVERKISLCLLMPAINVRFQFFRKFTCTVMPCRWLCKLRLLCNALCLRDAVMNLLCDKKIRLLNNAESVMLSQYFKKLLLPNNAFCLLPRNTYPISSYINLYKKRPKK